MIGKCSRRQSLSQRLLANRGQQSFGVRRFLANLLSFRPDVTGRFALQNLGETVRVDLEVGLSKDGPQLKLFIPLSHEIDDIANPGTVCRCISPVALCQPVTANKY